MPTLDWIGKQAVVNHHRQVPFHLLEVDPALSAGDPSAGNLLVQGDNLLALKALLPYYAGKVKCIYIDPPYNTGNEDWVYNDNVNSPEMRAWLGKTVGKEAEDLSRHDKWLCMMYPRLALLRDFLSDDGAIFVSIDDNELASLRMVMDEIFGLKKRLATFVWRTDGNFDNQAKIKNCHEYILAYTTDPDSFARPAVLDPSVSAGSKLHRPYIQNTIVKNGPKNPISSVNLKPGFPANFSSGVVKARSDAWPNYDVDLLVSEGKLVSGAAARSGWSSKELLIEYIDNEFNPVRDSKGQVTTFALTETGAIESKKMRETPSHVISVISGVGSTQNQSAELSAIGFSFRFPKPVALVSYLISLIADRDCLVLDSFAGSGTTGHAVITQNAVDGGCRRFLTIEMETAICRDITAPRLAKAIEGGKAGGYAVGFHYCTLGESLFDETGAIRGSVRFPALAAHVFFTETGSPLPAPVDGTSPLLGVHDGRAVYLLYNGVLGDKRPESGNVLTAEVLRALPPHDGPKVVFGEGCTVSRERLAQAGIEFRQVPYELRVG